MGRNMKIHLPYGVTNVVIENTGRGWAVSFDTDTAPEPTTAADQEGEAGAAPTAAGTAFSPAEAPAPDAVVQADGAEQRREEKRRLACERQRRKRERDRAAGGTVTRDSVTPRDNGVTSRVTERDSIQGVDCLIDGFINYSQENINKNQSIKQETRYQRSAARCVTSRVTPRDSVTPSEESGQLYLNIDYPLPAALDLPEIREAWQNWIKKRREEWGIYRISPEVVREIFGIMETAWDNGGAACVVAVIKYNIERERKNRWVRPSYEAPAQVQYYTAPEDEPETEEEKEESLRICQEVLRSLKGGRAA